jgi:hypothetical protein
MSEKATMKLAFAAMIRASGRWCRVLINDSERHQSRLLRAELGLDPPPTEDHATRRGRRSSTERHDARADVLQGRSGLYLAGIASPSPDMAATPFEAAMSFRLFFG